MSTHDDRILRAIRDPEFVRRFNSRIDRSGECWTWTATLDDKGYGLIGAFHGPQVRAHRVAWALEYGTIPPGVFICHKCDNPPCVRASHLNAGDHRSNMDEMVKRDRACRGERIGFAVLKEPDVLAIRAALLTGTSGRKLAKQFGVDPDTVYHISNRRTWKHLP